MIVSSCPTRLSLGSADHSPFAEGWGGVALNFCIKKRVYVIIRERTKLEKYKFRISYSKTQLCNEISEIKLPIVKAAFDLLNINKPLEIIYSADVPATLGLGTSSSFALAILKGLYSVQNTAIANEILAYKAYDLERKYLGEIGGFQDQYSCFGGINYLTGRPYNVRRQSVALTPEQTKNFENHMLLIYTGQQKASHSILREQLHNLKKGFTTSETAKIKTLVNYMHSIISSSNFNPLDLIEPLREAWELKKKLSSSMVTSVVEEIENIILKIAPYAGYRLVGSGGGRGVMLVIVKPEDRARFLASNTKFKMSTIELDWEGTKLTPISHKK